MKKAISVLLILATMLSCCVWFFACKPKDDETTTTEDGGLKDNSKVILNLEDANTASSAGLSPSDKGYDLAGATTSAKWNVNSQKILNLTFEEKGLSDYKEISFWMLNDSKTDIDKFAIYFVMEDGTEVRTKAVLDYQHSGTIVGTVSGKPVNYRLQVQNITIHPGWNHYKLPLTEVDPMWDKSYAYVPASDEDEEGTIDVKFDKSKIVGIKLAAHNSTTLNSQQLYITSLRASNIKTGTLAGYAIDNIANAVCFYEDSNAYLYNQNRYILHSNEKLGVKGDKSTAMVPIEVLARHRGAEITANDKEAKFISFNYNGKSYTFKDGDEISFVGDERGFSAGVDLKATVAMLGDYVTIPMEKAAEIFGYQLFYDQMGLVVFSDNNLKDIYLHPLHESYRSDSERGMPAVYLIIQVIIFKNYRGSEIIEDMNAIHGEDGHTKLMLTQEMFDVLRERLENDQVYAAWFNRFESSHAKGSPNYNSALPQFERTDGYRLLNVSREVMECLLSYAFLYKMTDNEDYAIKVKKTMMACTRFVDKELTNTKSWHPEHTLDTGELMYAYGIAYDWCYDYLAKDKKDLQTLEESIWELGYGAMMGFGDLYEWWDNRDNLKKYNEEMEADGDPSTTIWQKYELDARYNIDNGTTYKKYDFNRYMWLNNWGAVCNGGTLVMALAFANVNTEFRAASEYLLDCAMFNFPPTLFEGYGPDGGYPEGPGYWGYGTSYSILLIAALTTATGSDMGFTMAPGFRESFYFINGTASVAKGSWDYHDAHVGKIDGSRFFWFAYHCGDKNIAAVRYNQLNNGDSSPYYWDLMFYDPANIASEVALDLDYCYYGVGVATFHSDWTDSALFCGLHGGANAASHGQLDIGNFIVEYGGTRFFMDLGADEYNLAGYKNGEVTYFMPPYRYWYYRMRAEGHNTLVINPSKVITNNLSNGEGQKTNYDSNYSAESDILRYESGTTSALAVIDMACAYRTSDAYKSAFQSQALTVYYECPSCGYETPGICDAARCTGKTQMNLVENNGTYSLACPAGGCGTKKSAACPDCGTTLESKRNGIRGMLVCENRTTVVIQDEMWLDTAATKVLWMGHVPKDTKIILSEDAQSALIQADGKTLLVEMVFPEGYDINWRFETQAADYLPETGLVMTPGEANRDGLQKLVAIAESEKNGQQVTEIKIAVVCKLLSAGPHNYTWTDIEDWTTDR